MARPGALLDAIMAFEDGDLDEDATVDLFQDLVNSGFAYSLQGFYGRTADALIDQGLVVRGRRVG